MCGVAFAPTATRILFIKTWRLLFMAIFHLHLKTGKQGNGRLHCDYINREGRYGSGKMKEELVYKECGNLPHWAKSPSEFFDNADLFERSNGNPYCEFEVGLQAELSLEENIDLVKKLVNEHIGNQKVWAFAIHEKLASLEANQRQPHAHIMFSERIMTDEASLAKYPSSFFARYNRKNPELGGYEKDNRFSQNKHISSANLMKVREFWEQINNEAFIKNGLDIKISCKSLDAQRQEALDNNDTLLAESLDRPVQPHLGARLAGQMSRALQKEDFNIDMLSLRGQVAFTGKMLKKVKEEIRERKQILEDLQEDKNMQKEVVQEFANNTYQIYGMELISKINALNSRWEKHFFRNDKKIDELRKDVCSDESLHEKALDIFTKGYSSKLSKSRRKIESLKTAYEQEYKKFRDKEEPNFWQLKAIEAYKKEEERLENWRQEINAKIINYQACKKAYDEELAKEEVQERFEIIKKKLALKRESANRFIEGLKAENKNISNFRMQLFRMNKLIHGRSKFTVDEEAIRVLEQGSFTEVKEAVKKIQQAIMCEMEEQRKIQNKMRINLRGRDRDDDEYDLGI